MWIIIVGTYIYRAKIGMCPLSQWMLIIQNMFDQGLNARKRHNFTFYDVYCAPNRAIVDLNLCILSHSAFYKELGDFRFLAATIRSICMRYLPLLRLNQAEIVPRDSVRCIAFCNRCCVAICILALLFVSACTGRGNWVSAWLPANPLGWLPMKWTLLISQLNSGNLSKGIRNVHS